MKPLAFIIEDSFIIADMFKRAMEAAGYKTELIPDGKTALKRLAQAEPDIVLLDLHLPDMAGEEILVHIRTQERLSCTSIFVTSSNGTRASHVGDQADLILQKPIDYHQLRQLSDRFNPVNRRQRA